MIILWTMMHCCRINYPIVYKGVKISSTLNIYSSKMHINAAVILIQKPQMWSKTLTGNILLQNTFTFYILSKFKLLPCSSTSSGTSAGRLGHHGSLQGPGAAGGGACLRADEQQHTWGSGLHTAVALPPSRIHRTGHGEAPQGTGWALG